MMETRIELANAMFEYLEIFHNRQPQAVGGENVAADTLSHC